MVWPGMEKKQKLRKININSWTKCAQGMWKNKVLSQLLNTSITESQCWNVIVTHCHDQRCAISCASADHGKVPHTQCVFVVWQQNCANNLARPPHHGVLSKKHELFGLDILQFACKPRYSWSNHKMKLSATMTDHCTPQIVIQNWISCFAHITWRNITICWAQWVTINVSYSSLLCHDKSSGVPQEIVQIHLIGPKIV